MQTGPRLLGALCAFTVGCTLSAQVAVREDATFASVAKTPATVSVGLKNSSTEPLQAVLTLEWIPPEGKPHVTTHRTMELNPGESSLEVPLPLSPDDNPLTERLRYQLSPSSKNYAAFGPQEGILSLPEIAEDAFALSVVTADVPRRDRPYPIHVLAAHPVTHRPMVGVAIRCNGSSGVTDADGIATLEIRPDDHAKETDSVTIEGKLGDYVQTHELSLRALPDRVNVYTDKPLYQPGQTMHVRILALSSAGPVRANLANEIRVLDERQNVVFSAKVNTSRFGVASADWSIPENAKSGNYAIEVERKDDDSDSSFRRQIEIRRYELPSFRVSAKPEHTFYLAGQKAVIDIAAEYLFGKPVESGTTRITEKDSDRAIVTGELKSGHFKATVDAGEISERIQFSDRHLVAYVTDGSTNRTEQHKFDLRISRHPINVYVAKNEQEQHDQVVYISAYLPDGQPARATASVVGNGKKLASAETNRYGLARLAFGGGDYESLSVRITSAVGSAEQPLFTAHGADSRLWLSTDHILYRAAQAVRCHVTADIKDARVLLVGWNANGQTVLSRELTLRDGAADVEIPYQARFGNQISLGVASAALNSSVAKTVLFPGAAEFKVLATPAAATYRPGDVATVKFETPGTAALGVAIVDESVLERAQTDANPRPSFDYNAEPEIAGIRARDLVNLDPARIDEDLQLVAAVLVPEPAFATDGDNLETEIQNAFLHPASDSLKRLRSLLDEHYAATLEFPRNRDELQSILGYEYASARDPWLQPWYPEFAVEGRDYVLRLVSSGPDKKRSTPDDFSGLELHRNWFMPYQGLMTQQLKQLTDYPATGDEFKAVVHKAGIDFDALRDPWGSSLRVAIGYEQQHRVIRILSAGPDTRWDTADDLTVAEFSGYYFRSSERELERAIFTPAGFPKDEADVRARLRDAGIDFDALRDPWGHPYHIALSTEDSWGDDVEIYTYAEYRHSAEQKKSITPVKRHLLVLQIRSAGADGIAGTYDDFSVAEFRRIARDEKATPSSQEFSKLPTGHIAGTGTIRGQVSDPSGAAISNAWIVLNELYESRTDWNGEYEFSGVPPGVYRLRAESQGFQRYELAALPVEADRITQANIVLNVGSVAETVEVSSSWLQLATKSAEVASAQQLISTPRLREYFPETLFWAPEVITGKDGKASVQVKLADSVTAWHIAVMASTMDGQVAEADAEIRAFQPLVADLDLPQVLTVGDLISLPVPIRNYTGQAQQVVVSNQFAESLGSGQSAPERLTIPASSSKEAALSLHAMSGTERASVQVSVLGRNASDAIKRTLAIHPDGERCETVANGIASSKQPLLLEIPATAIPGSMHAEVTIFPSLLSRILASVRALLTRPYGCAEQTISASYSNLLFLRALRQTNIDGGDLAVRAEKNLRDGYGKLLNYQDADGAFSYWGHQDRPDVALTAYALQFLHDAKDIISVDPERLERARKWLAAHASEDASSQALSLLSRLQSGTVTDVDEQLGKIARHAAQTDDPYATAEFAMAAMNAGKTDLARDAVANLRKCARDEQGTAYWDLHTNTPFHGWGRAGQIETTALVVAALAKWRETNANDLELNALINRGVLFLFRNAGPDGAWMTSQATVQALGALMGLWQSAIRPQRITMTMSVNNGPGQSFVLDTASSVQSAINLDISKFVHAGTVNRVSFSGGETAIQVQTAASWYEAWSKLETAKTLEFAASCAPVALEINQLSECDVSIGRSSFRGYGMLIANIGLPPGAEVDRGSLTALVEKGTIDSFEIAQDHVVIYVWPQAARTHIQFGFRPRFAMRAKAAQSALYDYYNPDEKFVIQPMEYEVK